MFLYPFFLQFRKDSITFICTFSQCTEFTNFVPLFNEVFLPTAVANNSYWITLFYLFIMKKINSFWTKIFRPQWFQNDWLTTSCYSRILTLHRKTNKVWLRCIKNWFLQSSHSIQYRKKKMELESKFNKKST